MYDSWLQQGYSQRFNERDGHRLGSRRLKLLSEDNEKCCVPKLHWKFARVPGSNSVFSSDWWGAGQNDCRKYASQDNSHRKKGCPVFSSLRRHACGVPLKGLLDCHERTVVQYSLMANETGVLLVKMWAQNEQLHHLLELVRNANSLSQPWNPKSEILGTARKRKRRIYILISFPDSCSAHQNATALGGWYSDRKKWEK